ncbi:helix-turn-helix domain-containing protein [Cellulosilyticum sp. I15G10I2]|uniref:helix-turn-helix domain-containing protein n=1 Tax=Cellulosilyticum sp. I15G10I2 TaxID=1892843 RepID=UPI00085CC2D4|nr:helix-turn-helix transcriptional regulator [Cellulosilyticum sp. I15G10I2]
MDSVRLSNIRKKKKLTQLMLAGKMGISTKSYNRKELGIIEFTRHEIEAVSKELELTLEDINEIFFSNQITKRQYFNLSS